MKAKGTKDSKNNRAKKAFIIALGVAAAGGAGFLAWDALRRKRNLQQLPESTDINDPVSTAPVIPIPTKSTKGATDNFPLKKGSSGARVMQLQQGLSKIIGAEAMKANGGIDGKFGKGTEAALKMSGYGLTVDEPTFNKIVMGNSAVILFDPNDVAKTLYRNASMKDINGVLLALRRISNTSEYSQVNEIYKEIPIVGKTIVTDLLDYAFKTNESGKQLIKSEFQRIGLKLSDAGKWSLQGFRPFKDIITLRDTVVTDSQYNKIPVMRNTILGEEVVNSNGMTWFKSVDNTVLQVPTQDIKYT